MCLYFSFLNDLHKIQGCCCIHLLAIYCLVHIKLLNIQPQDNAYIVAGVNGSSLEKVSETLGQPVEGVGHLEKGNQLFCELIFGYQI